MKRMKRASGNSLAAIVETSQLSYIMLVVRDNSEMGMHGIYSSSKRSHLFRLGVVMENVWLLANLVIKNGVSGVALLKQTQKKTCHISYCYLECDVHVYSVF